MKTLSRQPQNQILSAIGRHTDPTGAEQRIFSNAEFARATAITAAARIKVARDVAHIDPALTYGCVDWYLYPDRACESHRDKTTPISP